MPRTGFASITIREETHTRLKRKYEKNKDKLALQGIYGFGVVQRGYASSMFTSSL